MYNIYSYHNYYLDLHPREWGTKIAIYYYYYVKLSQTTELPGSLRLNGSFLTVVSLIGTTLSIILIITYRYLKISFKIDNIINNRFFPNWTMFRPIREVFHVIKRHAGHSKWQNIKHTKEEKDQQRARLFTQLCQRIKVAIQGRLGLILVK